jgi:SAM-dependent methyltransferase
VALDRAVEALALAPEADVLDLAAGTGKLTRALAERFARLVAVEPDDEMRAVLSGVEAVRGSAESIPLPDDSVDGVFVGDAFQWFDARAALREIARVLRPCGGLALLWNLWWETEPPIPEQALELLREPFVRSGQAARVEQGPTWRTAFRDSPFEPLRDEAFAGEIAVDAAGLIGLYLTTSSIAALPLDERDRLVDRLGTLLGGTYRLPLRTELAWTRLA